MEGENHTYCIRFVPAEMGMHTVSQAQGPARAREPFPVHCGAPGGRGSPQGPAAGALAWKGLKECQVGLLPLGLCLLLAGGAVEGGSLQQPMLGWGAQPSMRTHSAFLQPSLAFGPGKGAGGLAIATRPQQGRDLFETARMAPVAYRVHRSQVLRSGWGRQAAPWGWVPVQVYNTEIFTFSPLNTLRPQGLLGCRGSACMAILFSLPIQVTMRCQSSSTRSTSDSPFCRYPGFSVW